jgi:propanol-preferring alcohol dehydrogenase
MAEKMKAAVAHAFGRSSAIEEADVPPDGVLGEVVASGDWLVKPSLPSIPGHEDVSYAATAGEGVKYEDTEGKMKSHYSVDRLENINAASDR